MDAFQVAIDGPVGAGKSTVAKMVADKARYMYIDTGAIYRAAALYAAQKGLDPAELCERQAAELLKDISISFAASEQGQRIILNGTDVTAEIRTEDASRGASSVAVHKAVRGYATARARELAAKGSVVMDGRDIGTAVLPNAALKVYLDADVDTRAKRRFKELVAKGFDVKLEDIRQDVIQRDYNDSNRAEDPLRKADDAVVIDAGGITAEEAADMILALINQRERG